MAASPHGDRPSPSGRTRRRRENAPDLSFAAKHKPGPRLLEPAETWPEWTDRRTYADSLSEPSDWAAPVAEVRLRHVPQVDLTTTRIHPTEGPVLPLRDPEGGDL